jgi:hypothetical protein
MKSAVGVADGRCDHIVQKPAPVAGFFMPAHCEGRGFFG